jgi:hypothetical protein
MQAKMTQQQQPHLLLLLQGNLLLQMGLMCFLCCRLLQLLLRGWP